LFALM